VISLKLCDLVNPPFSSSDEHRTIQFSPTYKLAFSLLNEDAASGNPVMGWDIRTSFQCLYCKFCFSHPSFFELATPALLLPTLEELRPLHNFSIESQVRLQAPLAFELLQRDGLSIVDREHLSVFVNSEEWSLGEQY